MKVPRFALHFQKVIVSEEIMRRRIIIAMALLLPVLALGRAVQVLSIPTLIERSALVFVGRVEAITPSGIRTTMSYPTWRGVTFEWLNWDVEVVEPIKGVKKGQIIRTAMLSAPGGGLSFNPPGMVDPEVGKAYLLCLAPSTVSNTFAALTAPWDDNQGIFVLDRNFWLYGNYRKDGPRTVDRENPHADVLTRIVNEYNEKYGVLWSLVDDDGNLLPAGAEAMRKTYKDEIAAVPPTNTVIYLQWETQMSASGWQRDVPKGHTASTNSDTFPRGPITFPGSSQTEE